MSSPFTVHLISWHDGEPCCVAYAKKFLFRSRAFLPNWNGMARMKPAIMRWRSPPMARR